MMIDKETKEAVPVTAFLKAEQLAKDVAQVNDAGRGKVPVGGRHGARADAQLRPVQGADALQADRPDEEVRQDLRRDQAAEKGKYGKVEGDRTKEDIAKRRADRWNFLFIAGMWFQDLFNYDFRRTEMCIIPYATQQGEISFCAYNTGIGWRNIIEKMHMTATLTKWYEEHGRHEIFAGNKHVPLELDGALAEAERRSGGRAARRPTSTTWASPRTRAKRSSRRARSTRRRGTAKKRRITTRWPSSTAARAQGAADAADSGARRGRRRRTCRRSCTSRRRKRREVRRG